MTWTLRFCSLAAAACLTLNGISSQYALAATIVWDGGGGDSDWTNPLNWDGDVLPGASDVANINTPTTVDLSGATVAVGSPRISDGGVLNINAGASLNADLIMFLGRKGVAGTTGTLNVNGGTVSTDVSLIVGREGGILNMNSGMISIAADLLIGDTLGEGGGVASLDGGMITAGGFAMGPGPASMDITGGVLKVSGDITAYVDTLVGSGDITGYGGSGAVVRIYDPSSDITTVSAVIPEPASVLMALLTVAGASLFKRRPLA